MKLTLEMIKKSEPGAILRDSALPGFHLKATATGKSFYYYYRTKAGTERRPKIGNFPAISLEAARTIASQWAIAVTLGQDPSEERKCGKAAPRMSELWVRFKTQKEGRIKALAQYERWWSHYLAPKFGKKRVAEVTYDMVFDWHASMKDTPVQANRCLTLLTGMFTFAHRPLKWVNENPCKGVHRFKESRRRRYMNPEEATRVAELLQLEAADSPLVVAFIWLLIFTGARKSEWANAKWGDLQGNKLVLRQHKTDAHGEDRVIYLPPQALAVLEKLPQTNGLVLGGLKSPKHVWKRIRNEAGCPDLRIHDLRHSFASAAVKANLTLKQIGDLLGHTNPQTTQGYAHLMDDAGQAAATAAADVLEAMMRPSKVTV